MNDNMKIYVEFPKEIIEKIKNYEGNGLVTFSTEEYRMLQKSLKDKIQLYYHNESDSADYIEWFN